VVVSVLRECEREKERESEREKKVFLINSRLLCSSGQRSERKRGREREGEKVREKV